jgi:hypothetical protein
MSDRLTLRELVCVAALGYEQSSARAWDSLINEDGTLTARGKADDTLIDFIILKLHDIYDSAASRSAQVDQAIRAMELARDQLSRVDIALLLAEEVPSTQRELVKLACCAYDPDEPDAWDDVFGEDGTLISDFDEVLNRDTLAKFIVKELSTFVEPGPETNAVEQIDDVRRALGHAQDELSRVIYAFSDLIKL